MKSIFPLLLLLVITFPSSAQVVNRTISGVVKDSQNEPVPGATVRLFRSIDSTQVLGEITSQNGKFELNGLTINPYFLRISSVGSNDYQSGTLTIDDQHSRIVLPVIILSPSKTVLKEVVVVAKRPLIEQDIDKTTVNVDAMMSAASSNTLEVLEKTPGVTVDLNGEISLNGKAGVLVLIDGRPTYMSGPDLASYLKSLPGGSLDKLELMTNPPAKYDAAGTSVINIRLKRNRVKGFTGDISAGYSLGAVGRTNDVINANYTTKKLNFFGNLGYNQDATYSDDSYNRTFYEENGLVNSSVALQNHYKYTVQGVMTRLGMDYAVSPKTTYGFTINFQNRPRRDRLAYISKNFNAGSVLDSVGTGSTVGEYRWKNIGGNFNYQHKFNTDGRELVADLNYISYRSHGNQTLHNFMNLPDGTLTTRDDFLYDLPSDITIYTAKTDYVHPLKKKAILEAGFKSSLVNTDNDSHYYSVQGPETVPDYGKSNHFIYRENINAAYVNSRKEGKRWAAQLGFRLENTMTNGHQLGNAEVKATTFTKNYTRLFPTAFLRYKIDSSGHNSLTISLAERINRPNYQQLNPFLFYRDNYSYTTGNPLLRPQYHFQYEVKYQHKNDFGMALQYNRFSDVIFQMTEAIDAIFITSPTNVAKGRIVSLATNLSLSPANWWRFTTNVTFANMALRGVAYSEKLTPTINNARVTIQNQITFSKSWTGELSGYYSSKNLAGQTITNSLYRFNAAVQKKILNSKGSVRFMLEDLFHSWKPTDRTVSLKQAAAFHTNRSDTRRIGIAFSYRFGQETFARKRRHSDNAADSEKGRVD
ncbi:TonB-dependent receptor [Larkinella knui]|uniref:Outer membrane protein beta-barrel domain-containing protein n=1 Tax=Larkinella knui TaxID=2025310 RepID=A0A3P1CX92_9BACT|nr:outer membrane beta-barrel protein [Larkinella knui]RRB18037.1 hypothetical protein EHT87_07120 [Larkinella knui]